MRSVRPVALPIAALLLGAVGDNCAGAEVRVQGSADRVHVEADGATIAEILAALGKHYPVHYRGTPGSGGVTATFEGPLPRVLVRVLAGNDYVIRRVGDGLDVIVLGPTSSAATVPAFPGTASRERDPFMAK